MEQDASQDTYTVTLAGEEADGAYDVGTLVFPGYSLYGVPVAAPVSSFIQLPSYPSVLTFTVLSATTSGGRYEIVTDCREYPVFPDYYTWSQMTPQDTYTATITGEENGAFDVRTRKFDFSGTLSDGYLPGEWCSCITTHLETSGLIAHRHRDAEPGWHRTAKIDGYPASRSRTRWQMMAQMAGRRTGSGRFRLRIIRPVM